MSTTLYSKVCMFPVLCSSKQVSQDLLVTCAGAFRVLSKKIKLPFAVNSRPHHVKPHSPPGLHLLFSTQLNMRPTNHVVMINLVHQCFRPKVSIVKVRPGKLWICTVKVLVYPSFSLPSWLFPFFFFGTGRGGKPRQQHSKSFVNVRKN